MSAPANAGPAGRFAVRRCRAEADPVGLTRMEQPVRGRGRCALRDGGHNFPGTEIDVVVDSLVHFRNEIQANRQNTRFVDHFRVKPDSTVPVGMASVAGAR